MSLLRYGAIMPPMRLTEQVGYPTGYLSPWYEWTEVGERPLYYEGHWNGSAVVPLEQWDGAYDYVSPVQGYSAWWDFSNANSLTLSGSNIVSIADLSGNGYTLSKSGTAFPTLVTSTGLGNSTFNHARFPGTNDTRLYRSDLSGITGDATVFCAARKQTADKTATYEDFAFTAGGFALSVKSSTELVWYPRGGAGALGLSGISSVWTTSQVYVMRASGSSLNAWITDSFQTPRTGTSNVSNETNLGGDGYYGGDWDIGEMIVYPSALGTTDRESVTAYLMTKWGIT